MRKQILLTPEDCRDLGIPPGYYLADLEAVLDLVEYQEILGSLHVGQVFDPRTLVEQWEQTHLSD
jgi:hypothetical protein